MISLQNLLSSHDSLRFKTINKKTVAEKINNEQFQVGYMFYPGLNNNKAFKYQEKNISLTLDKKRILIKKAPKKDNTRILELMIFYENRKIKIFKVVRGSVIYSIMDNYFVSIICMTCSSPRRAVRSHSLVCSKNPFSIVGIGPIPVKEL